MGRIAKRRQRTGKARLSGNAAVVSDGLFHSVFHNSPAMQSLVRAADSVLVEVNDTFLQKFKRTREEVVGKTPDELDLWVEPEKLLDYRTEFQTKGKVLGYEVRLRAADGSILTVLLSSHRIEINGMAHVLSAGVDISERKQAEAQLRGAHEKLRQSEERFSKVFRASPALVVINRFSDGLFIAANETFLRTTGYVADEIVGRKSTELNLHAVPNQREEFLKGIEARGFVRDHEMRVYAKDGSIRTLLVSAELIEIDGAPHVQTVGLDITGRKEAEARLRESEARYRESEARWSTVFRASPAAVSLGRLADGKLVAVNEAFLRVTGFTERELLGHNSRELGLYARPEDRELLFERIKTQGFARDHEYVLRSRDGRLRNMILSAEIVEVDGAPHVLAVASDITARKEAEERLRESERRFRESEARARALYESISAAVVVQDETGFVQINPASLKLFGTDRVEEILGKHPAQFSAARQPDGEDSATAAQRHMARALAEGTHRFEWLGRRLDGTEFPVEVTLTALQLEGRPVLQAVIIDLTERKRAEAELQNALAKERELSQLKSDFVSLVSHEFRTPLEIIMSSADNLDRYHDRLPVEKREQLLRTINKSVRRMSQMMGEVLVLGRLESDRMTFKPAAFDLRAFCQRMGDEIESATGKRCSIRVQANGLLEEAFGDESVLRHIFTNLLSNAVKYSLPDQLVEFNVSRDGAEAICCIVDRGCGIPEADQKRLFQAFHRGSNVRQIPGTGLGLLIVQRCVDLHAGNIQFASVEGKGTTFTVRLPVFIQPGPVAPAAGNAEGPLPDNT